MKTLLVNMTRLKKKLKEIGISHLLENVREKGGNYEFYHIFRGENTIYSVSIIFSCTGFLSSLFIRGGRSYIFLMILIYTVFQIGFLWLTYRNKCRKNQRIVEMTDNLQEAYYISEILQKPKDLENQAYYYALKRACKAMNDKISALTEEQVEYQEYVESFAHEIKIPIGALSLTFDNARDYSLKKETDKIFQLVEQMLYYARSENTEKDYFVKELSLDEMMHHVLLGVSICFVEEKVTLDIHDMENTVYTDEKWLQFILSQILQNAVKYMNKEEKRLVISSIPVMMEIFRLSWKITVAELNSLNCRECLKKALQAQTGKTNATGMGLWHLKKTGSDRLGLQPD